MRVIEACLTRLIPRAKDRKALGVGLALIGTMLILGRGVPAWKAWEQSVRLVLDHNLSQLDAARAAISAHQSVVAQRGKTTQRLDSLSSAYIHAASITVASAALAILVSDVGNESGIRITSATVRPDSATKAAFARIAVRISATGDIQGLADFLSGIETSDELLAVRELSVAQAEPAAPDSRAEALRFDVLVEGLARIDEKQRDTVIALGRGTASQTTGRQ
ncbi:MAG TPA: type II secretion system protein GspM [Gemmatimonadaceae bacterium]